MFAACSKLCGIQIRDFFQFIPFHFTFYVGSNKWLNIMKLIPTKLLLKTELKPTFWIRFHRWERQIFQKRTKKTIITIIIRWKDQQPAEINDAEIDQPYFCLTFLNCWNVFIPFNIHIIHVVEIIEKKLYIYIVCTTQNRVLFLVFHTFLIIST